MTTPASAPVRCVIADDERLMREQLRARLAEVWPERPGLPQAKVYEHCLPQAPLPRSAKLDAVRAAMSQHGASHHFISTVDDIAWLFNPV